MVVNLWFWKLLAPPPLHAPRGLVIKQCMYSVTTKRVGVTNVPVERQLVLHILCVCVCVALGIQHATRMRHIVICVLSSSTLFFHIIS